MSDEAQLEKLADWLSAEWGERPEAMEVVHRERTIWPGDDVTATEILLCRFAMPEGYKGIGITGGSHVMPYAFTPMKALTGAFDWDSVPIENLKICHAGIQIFMRYQMRRQLKGQPAQPVGITEEDRAYEALAKESMPQIQRLVEVVRLGDWQIYSFRWHTEERGDEIYVMDGNEGYHIALDDPIAAFGACWFFIGDVFFREEEEGRASDREEP